MPTAKYGQLGALSYSDSSGHYVNHYLNCNYQQLGNISEETRSRINMSREATVQHAYEMRRWFESQGNPAVDYNGTSFLTRSSNNAQYLTELRRCQGEDRKFGEAQGKLAEDKVCPEVCGQASWYKETCTDRSASQKQAYERQPYCLSFASSTNDQQCEQFVYGNNSNASDTREHSRHLSRATAFSSSIRNKVCTEQPFSKLERVSQVDLAIEHCRQAKARQANCVLSNDVYRQNHVENLSVDRANTCANSRTNNCDSSRQPFNPNMENQGSLPQTARPEAVFYNPSTFGRNMALYDVGESNAQRRSRDSTSSDPEIYTKTPSTEKFSAQIKKLRDEMLALRSTSVAYKLHMEKMFEDLKLVKRIYASGKAKWNRLENHGAMPSDFDACETYNEYHLQQPSEFSTTNNRSQVVIPFNMTSTPSMDKSEVPGSQPSTLPTYENLMETRCSSGHVITRNQIDDSQSKCNKSAERPNSDPFYACADAIFGAEVDQAPSSSMSLPHGLSSNKYTSKSQGSSLEKESNWTKRNKEQFRIIPVLSKSNAMFHVSECSIDSGYQGSSVTSPRDRLSRDPASQVVTPASPINESPIEVNEEQKSLKSPRHLSPFQGIVRMCPSTEQSSESSPQTAETQTRNGSNESDGKKHTEEVFIDDDQISSRSNLQRESGVQPATKPTQIIKLKAYDGPSKSRDQDGAMIPKTRSSKGSTGSDISGGSYSNKVKRPVPKQRTVFAAVAANSTNEITIKSGVFVDNSEQSDTPVDLETDKPNYRPSGSISSRDDASETRSNASTNTSQPSAATRPQCLKIIKPTGSQASSDTGSPLQSRVKLGVSAIKKLTPNNELKEGSSFFSGDGQVPKPNQGAKKHRKNPSAKQLLLREKFAAAIEHSAKEANKETVAVDDDGESSMVRRRSMRMMTEFQIVDFKDSANRQTSANKKHGGKVASQQKTTKPKSVGTSQPVQLTVDESPSTYAVASSVATVFGQATNADTNEVKCVRNEKDVSGKPKKEMKNNGEKISTKANDFENLKGPVSATNYHPPADLHRTHPLEHVNPAVAAPARKNVNVGQVPTKHPTFLAPLIRPKVSGPGISHDATASPSVLQDTSFKGLILSPNSKSAFVPISPAKPIPNKQINSSSATKLELPNDSDAEVEVGEFKRRVSLPASSVSNKQRFLKEFSPSAARNDTKSKGTPSSDNDKLTDFHRRTSLRVPRSNKDVVESIISAEKANVTSYKLSDDIRSQVSSTRKDRGYTTTEPLFSEIPKNSENPQKRERTRHSSCDKITTYATSNDVFDLEKQPVHFDRSDKITNVVGALKSAGYWNNPVSTGHKSSASAASSLNSNKGKTKEINKQFAPVQLKTRLDALEVAEANRRSYVKSRSSSSLHHYETIMITDTRDNKIVANQSKQPFPEGGATERSQQTRSHKSTIALIRASLLGKRDKAARSNAAEGKRGSDNKNDSKSRSSSAGPKKKVPEEQFLDSKNSSKQSTKDKSKKPSISTTKKNKNESKLHREKSAEKHLKDHFYSSGKEKHSVSDLPERRCSPVLPDSGPLRYGNPDSEVMQRFLEAAAASHAAPQSPLQKLRSSFRVPKKNKIFNSSRVKDDMDVSGGNWSFVSYPQNHKKLHNGQEFTYV